MITVLEHKNKLAAAISIGIHALLLLLFVLIVFITPLPPFEMKESQAPPEIIMDLGMGMEGMGHNDAGGEGQNDPTLAASPDAGTPEPQQPAPVNNTSAPPVITDPTESTPVNANPKSTSDNDNVKPEPQVSEALKNILNASRSKVKTEGKGQGSNNTGGSGKGAGQGVGDGSDTGHGNNPYGQGNGTGRDYDLSGRVLVKKPDDISDTHEAGTVVVEIIVDENGKVIKAEAGKRGTTTSSPYLFAKARQAALSVKFNPSPEGIKEQRGTFTFKFVLQ